MKKQLINKEDNWSVYRITEANNTRYELYEDTFLIGDGFGSIDEAWIAKDLMCSPQLED